MFAKAIKSRIHPATWAVVGVKHTAVGDQVGHRGTAFAIDSQGHLLTCWHVTYMDDKQQDECDELWVAQPDFSQTRYLAKVVKKEQNCDIALLKIDGKVTR